MQRQSRAEAVCVQNLWSGFECMSSTSSPMHIIMSLVLWDPSLVIILLAATTLISTNHNLFNTRISADVILQLPELHFKANFGLTNKEFQQVHTALRIPHQLETHRHYPTDSQSALLMLLGYLQGRSLAGLESQFGWSVLEISSIKLTLTEWILAQWKHCTSPILNCSCNLESYTHSLKQKCKVGRIWGFVDGTLWPVARPSQYQEAAYNGHKHIHALKYQIVSTPDGLLFVQGPWDGNEHDWLMWHDSGIHSWLSSNSQDTSLNPLFLFGDKGYYPDNNLIVPYQAHQAILTSDEKHFNRIMSKYCITVEWAIGSVSIMFPRLNNWQQQKAMLTPVAQEYLVACILRNAVSCCSGNTTSQYFELNPPSLSDYFVDLVCWFWWCKRLLWQCLESSADLTLQTCECSDGILDDADVLLNSLNSLVNPINLGL